MKIKSDYIDKLKEYKKYDKNSFHMPGHKFNRLLKKSMPRYLFNVLKYDITENKFLDDLNHPEGLIKDYEIKAAKIYKTKQSIFICGGATCCILSIINALVGIGEEIIIARNSHKSVYNACRIGKRIIHEIGDNSLNKSISRDMLEMACKKYINSKIIVITSPTYIGVISNIKELSEVAHKYGMILVVDEAHGAHLPFVSRNLSAVENKADIVIQSLHKMMPVLTNGAIIHINNNTIDTERIYESIRVFQSSSPSFVIIASMMWFIDYIMHYRYIIKEYFDNMKKYTDMLKNRFGESIYNLKGEGEVFDIDYSKIIINISKYKISGDEILHIFRKKFKIECEGIIDGKILIYTSAWNTGKNYKMLKKAIEYIESNYKKDEGYKKTEINLIDIKDKKAKRDIYAYPPGNILIKKGEIITPKKKEELIKLINNNVNIKGMGK